METGINLFENKLTYKTIKIVEKLCKEQHYTCSIYGGVLNIVFWEKMGDALRERTECSQYRASLNKPISQITSLPHKREYADTTHTQ